MRNQSEPSNFAATKPSIHRRLSINYFTKRAPTLRGFLNPCPWSFCARLMNRRVLDRPVPTAHPPDSFF